MIKAGSLLVERGVGEGPIRDGRRGNDAAFKDALAAALTPRQRTAASGWEAVGSANATPPDHRPGFARAGIPGCSEDNVRATARAKDASLAIGARQSEDNANNDGTSAGDGTDLADTPDDDKSIERKGAHRACASVADVVESAATLRGPNDNPLQLAFVTAPHPHAPATHAADDAVNAASPTGAGHLDPARSFTTANARAVAPPTPRHDKSAMHTWSAESTTGPTRSSSKAQRAAGPLEDRPPPRAPNQAVETRAKPREHAFAHVGVGDASAVVHHGALRRSPDQHEASLLRAKEPMAAPVERGEHRRDPETRFDAPISMVPGAAPTHSAPLVDAPPPSFPAVAVTATERVLESDALLRGTVGPEGARVVIEVGGASLQVHVRVTDGVVDVRLAGPASAPANAELEHGLRGALLSEGLTLGNLDQGSQHRAPQREPFPEPPTRRPKAPIEPARVPTGTRLSVRA